MSFDIRLDRLLDTTPDVAFHHWVDADARRRWYRGDAHDWVVEAHTDLRVGGRFWVTWGPTLELSYREEGAFLVVERTTARVTSRFTPIPRRGRSSRFGHSHFATRTGETAPTYRQGYPTAEGGCVPPRQQAGPTYQRPSPTANHPRPLRSQEPLPDSAESSVT